MKFYLKLFRGDQNVANIAVSEYKRKTFEKWSPPKAEMKTDSWNERGLCLLTFTCALILVPDGNLQPALLDGSFIHVSSDAFSSSTCVYPSKKLTWQWKFYHFKMYFLLKMGIFQRHGSFRMFSGRYGNPYPQNSHISPHPQHRHRWDGHQWCDCIFPADATSYAHE